MCRSAAVDDGCSMSESPGSVLPSADSIRTDQLFENYVKAKSRADTSGDRVDGLTAGQAWREFLDSFRSEEAHPPPRSRSRATL
jgi:hypothetical protein